MTLHEKLAEALRYLDEVRTDLASVQDQLAGPRIARRAVRDRFAQACAEPDHANQIIRNWRPPTPDEVEEVDAVHRATAPIIAELTPVERSLKEARRVANVQVEAIRKAIKKGSARGSATGGFTGGATGETIPPVRPPKGGDRGKPPVPPP